MAQRTERGQGTVEFTLFMVMLTLTLMLLIQLTWVGVQKWHFNFTSMMAARTWSVWGDASPGLLPPKGSLFRVTAAETVHHPQMLLTFSFAKVLFASEETSAPSRWQDRGFTSSMGGIKYTGTGTILPIFAGGVKRGGIDATLAENPLLEIAGQFRFETYIAMEREPEEHTSGPKRDNDCDSYSLLVPPGECQGNGK